MGRSLNVLVTGGCGFIGSHLVDHLMKQENYVRVVDNLSLGNTKNVKRWLDHPNFEFIHGDLKEPAIATCSISNVDTVFHFAANSEVRVGETDPSVQRKSDCDL